MDRLQERLFWGGSRKELEVITRLSIKEIEAADSVSLPQEIADYAANAIKRTTGDHREYWAFFGVNNGLCVVTEEGRGEELNFDTNAAESLSFNRFDAAKRIYFDHPQIVSFHTHPSFSTSYFRERGVVGANHKLGRLSLEQISILYDLRTRNFSDIDLDLIERNGRYVCSMLLGSVYGYRWLIKPSFQLPWVATNRFSREYGRRYEEMTDIEVGRMIQFGGLVDRQLYNRRVDELLVKFCNETGMVVFGNDDCSSRVCTRLV